MLVQAFFTMSFKISVLTPSYNSVNFLDRAIQSVLSQDYTNWEHIVMDAGSQDGTKEILTKYPHLIWESEPDKGQSDAMNKAFTKSTGDIIVYLNADDYFKEGAFRAVVEAFDANPNMDIIVGSLEINDEIIGVKQIVVPTIDLSEIIQLYKGFVFPANPVSYFYKKNVQVEIGEFPLDNHYTMDFWFLLRVFSRYRAHKFGFILGTFSMYGTNKTSDKVLANTHLFTTVLEYLQSDSGLDSLKWSENIVSNLHNTYLTLETHYRDLETHYQDLSVNHSDLETHYRKLEFEYHKLENNIADLKQENKGLQQELVEMRDTMIWKIRTFLRNFLRK